MQSTMKTLSRIRKGWTLNRRRTPSPGKRRDRTDPDDLLTGGCPATVARMQFDSADNETPDLVRLHRSHSSDTLVGRASSRPPYVEISVYAPVDGVDGAAADGGTKSQEDSCGRTSRSRHSLELDLSHSWQGSDREDDHAWGSLASSGGSMMGRSSDGCGKAFASPEGSNRTGEEGRTPGGTPGATARPAGHENIEVARAPSGNCSLEGVGSTGADSPARASAERQDDPIGTGDSASHRGQARSGGESHGGAEGVPLGAHSVQDGAGSPGGGASPLRVSECEQQRDAADAVFEIDLLNSESIDLAATLEVYAPPPKSPAHASLPSTPVHPDEMARRTASPDLAPPVNATPSRGTRDLARPRGGEPLSGSDPLSGSKASEGVDERGGSAAAGAPPAPLKKSDGGRLLNDERRPCSSLAKTMPMKAIVPQPLSRRVALSSLDTPTRSPNTTPPAGRESSGDWSQFVPEPRKAGVRASPTAMEVNLEETTEGPCLQEALRERGRAASTGSSEREGQAVQAMSGRFGSAADRNLKVEWKNLSKSETSKDGHSDLSGGSGKILKRTWKLDHSRALLISGDGSMRGSSTAGTADASMGCSTELTASDVSEMLRRNRSWDTTSSTGGNEASHEEASCDVEAAFRDASASSSSSAMEREHVLKGLREFHKKLLKSVPSQEGERKTGLLKHKRPSTHDALHALTHKERQKLQKRGDEETGGGKDRHRRHNKPQSPYKKSAFLKASALQKNVLSPRTVVLDLRSESMYDEKHVRLAVSLPLADVFASLAPHAEDGDSSSTSTAATTSPSRRTSPDREFALDGAHRERSGSKKRSTPSVRGPRQSIVSGQCGTPNDHLTECLNAYLRGHRYASALEIFFEYCIRFNVSIVLCDEYGKKATDGGLAHLFYKLVSEYTDQHSCRALQLLTLLHPSIQVLQGGFAAYHAFVTSKRYVERFHFGSNELRVRRQRPSPALSVVLQKSLFLGRQINTQEELDELKKRSISHLMNLTSDPSATADVDINYLHLPLRDSVDQRLSISFLDEVTAQMSDILNGGSKLYVHCSAGVSRSPSLVLAYLIRKESMSLRAAFQKTLEKRSSIAPNIRFLFDLLCYEFHVRTAALSGERCDQVEGWQVSLPLHWYLNELMGKESLEESFQLMLEDEYHPFAPSH